MSDTVQKPSKVSREGVVLIKSFEGFRSRAVQRGDGHWAIGYGHTLSAREGLRVTEAEAELLLQYDLIPVVKAVSAIPASLNQHQFDALASFIFSIGVERFGQSDVLARLTADAHGEAADALIAWPDDRAADAPPRRRAAERALFVAPAESAVTLVDLLAAPLPFPSEIELGAASPAAASRDTEAAADAPAVVADNSQAEPVAPFPPATTFEGEASSSSSTVQAGAAAAQLHSPYAVGMTGLLAGVGDQAADLRGLDAAPAPANDVGAAAVALVPPALHGQTATAAAISAPEAAAQATFAPIEASSLIASTATGAQAGPAAAVPPTFVAPALETPAVGHDAHLGVRDGKRAKPSGWFDASNTAPMVIMGLIGLVSLGAAMAAFRRAAAYNGQDTGMIAWVLAIIAAACLAVSGFNLWQRWGRSERL